MTLGLLVLATVLFPILLGSPVISRAEIRSLPFAARFCAAWIVGVAAWTFFSMLTSLVGLIWRPTWLLAGAAAGSIGGATRAWASSRSRLASPRSEWLPEIISVLFLVALALAFLGGLATSGDLAYFWGGKGSDWADAGGIRFDSDPFLIHTHAPYPPLWPILLSWARLLIGTMPWREIPALTAAWVALAAGLINGLLHRKLGPRAAATITAFWLVAMSTSLLQSFSGGTAEGPLLLFLSVAIAILLLEDAEGPRPLRWLAAVALAGAVLTKTEGVVAVGLIGGGTILRDHLWRRRDGWASAWKLLGPAAFLSFSWIVVRVAAGGPLSDPIRESALAVSFEHVGLIAKLMVRTSGGGLYGLGWWLPALGLLLTGPRRWSAVLPGLVLAVGLPMFAFAYYLHAVGDPLELVVWTFPRLVQPALSAWILSIGIATFHLQNDVR